ncbi:4-(cytidine 5'-diphospho)-2-C-methyl-D-erythritol kinase [Hominisplanchenecus murintestinalis]|uniref:4-(Cytidine 5'-diphospho)-2-C-methyl-D-erythritol kinase n=1 Tax=Hominisplanchenecus murintestinalis TaxID=2941517 RepID=A0AC61QVV3_9FIRM|nr:4-(cytidine 5'-diphospho)-2-C-methyl-D-erythritol kinase [Hominisplanchenecus murintestinalis]TGX96596.1 4-(cytidine 5'-diphospho)-2-C-methyl-D-erythritol kinase [Hominisplanchenecus murintestinalis]
MKEIRMKALAKINLGLDVVKKREDGYHEVRMIMQTVKLYDQIDIHKMDKPGIRLKTNLQYLPVDENNLAYRAARLLIEEFGIPKGVSIRLRKVIPIAAGMAGGSSDAAAVLVGLNRIFQLGLTKQELMERSVKLGADVPYCILRGTALAEGIGEKLTRLPAMPKCHVLIAKPGIHVSTKMVYTNLRADELVSHPDIDGQIAAIRERDLRRAAELMGNVLETVTIPAYPVIGKIKEKMMAYGALGAMMSGSGPTVFGLFEDEEKARYAYEKMRRGSLAKQVYLTRIMNHGGDANDR